MAILHINDVEIKISDKEYDRFKRNAERNPSLGRVVLKSGTIINLHKFSHITPSRLDGIEENEDLSLIPEEIETEKKSLKQEESESSEPVLTGKQISEIIKKSKLTGPEFVESLGFPKATLRMAVKENRVKPEFSNAIREKYLTEDSKE